MVQIVVRQRIVDDFDTRGISESEFLSLAAAVLRYDDQTREPRQREFELAACAG